MFILFLIGVATLQTGDMGQHRTQFQMHGFRSQDECLEAGESIKSAIRDNLGRSITVTQTSCRREHEE